MVKRSQRYRPSPAYTDAAAGASSLWAELDRRTDPAARSLIYLPMARAYTTMAAVAAAGDIPAGYDGDLRSDLQVIAGLCGLLEVFEYNIGLGCPASWPGTFNGQVPGYDADPALAAAWQRLWASGDRAERARLLNGAPAGPTWKGTRRREGIIPLTGPHAGSAVTGFLHQLADAEGTIARRLARPAVQAGAAQ